MAELIRRHPTVHLTINLTPNLLWQIEDYVEAGTTDRALDLTLKPAESLDTAEREYVLSTLRTFDCQEKLVTSFGGTLRDDGLCLRLARQA